jgi:hypothetical protein
VPNVSLVGVNGNNLHVVSDLVRRTLRATLDANVEAPEQRIFKHSPLAAARADRGGFLANILTAARAYLLAGSPERPTPLPSFGPWSDLVRGLLIWSGRADPTVSIARGRADDPNRQAIAAFLDTFPTELTRYTAAELIQAATEQHHYGKPVRPDFLAGSARSRSTAGAICPSIASATGYARSRAASPVSGNWFAAARKTAGSGVGLVGLRPLIPTHV